MLTAKPSTEDGFPAYPTKLQAEADPGLLKTEVSWPLAQLLAAGAAGSLLLAAIGGCSKEGQAAPPAPTTQAATQNDTTTQPTTTTAPASAAVVAPLFEHGEGTAADGCQVIAPPVYLSEEAALRIITEELKNAGIVVKANPKAPLMAGPSALDVDEYTKGYVAKLPPEQRAAEIKKIEALSKKLQMDLESSNVFVEYVSAGDVDGVGAVEMSSVSVLDYKAVANATRRRLAKAPTGYYGVFYDPGEKSDGKLAVAQKARKSAEAQLRLQVKDFVAWLQKEGVAPPTTTAPSDKPK